LPDLQVEPLNVDQGTTKFDLSVDLLETANGLDGTIEYSTEIFSAGSISRVVEHYHAILNQFLIQPDERISAFDLFDDHTVSLIHALKSLADFNFDLSKPDSSISAVLG
jgi:non-ribosomal peptide synthetase component F